MSASNYYLDSIKNTNSYKNSGDAAQLAALSTYPTHNNLYIETNSFTNAITHTEHTKVQTLSKVQYVETISPAWKLETERKTINGIPCQKASCTLFGGTWTAWYSTSIPLPFGPYKFHGLPGLIVQLENSNKTHVFTLYAHQNIDRKFPLTSFEPLQKTDKQHAVNLVNKGKYTTASFDGVTVVDDPTFVSRLQKKLDERRKR